MKKGQTILFVLFLLAVLGILSGTTAVMWQSELMTRSSEKEGLAALYIAQAGLERGKIWAKYNSPPYASGAIAMTGGQYSITVIDLGGSKWRVTSVGQALSGGQVVAERDITVDIQLPGYTQVGWTWREI